MRRGWAVGLAILVLAPAAARAQGFMVKPMRLQLDPRRGETVQREIEIRNTTADTPVDLEIEICRLGQAQAGTWQVVAPDEPASPRDAAAWVRASATLVQVPVREVRTVEVSLTVPRDARGTYAAGLLVRTKAPPPRPGEIRLLVQFLIPIVINIEGPTARQSVQVDGVAMRHLPATEARPAATAVGVRVANSGETYASVGARVALLRPMGAGWDRITELVLDPVGLLPGSSIILGKDVFRVLPSGRYRVSGALTVGGRTHSPIEAELDFAGDPQVRDIATDVNLVVEPALLTAAAVQGSRRSTLVTIHNPTASPVNIVCGAATPEALKGVALGDMQGETFACTSWVTVEPERFPLGPGAKRTIRVTLNYPADEAPKANYYSELRIMAVTADDQLVGQATSLIVVEDPQQQVEPAAQPVRIALDQAGENLYSVVAQFANVGQVHFLPTAQVFLRNRLGHIVAQAEMETASGLILPLGTPQFAGQLDIKNAEAGIYMVQAVMSFVDRQAVAELPIEIGFVDGRRRLTILESPPTEDPPAG